jgi:hypothetical protein
MSLLKLKSWLNDPATETNREDMKNELPFTIFILLCVTLVVIGTIITDFTIITYERQVHECELVLKCDSRLEEITEPVENNPGTAPYHP